MKLHLASNTTQNTFTGYGEGFVLLNGRKITTNVVVMPEQLIEPWPAESFESLAAEHFGPLLQLLPEIVLLGTGPRFRFPQPAITRELSARRIGLEVMDTAAACRTYNILLAEGRSVCAALFVA
jgi:uncharacterized protein